MLDDPVVSQTLNAWSEVFMHRSMREFKIIMDENGLSASQMIILFRLYHGATIHISDIGSQLSVSKAASSQMIDRLVLMKLVDRVEHPIDRRMKQLTITETGKHLVEQVINARRRWMEELVAELTSEQEATVISALTMLTNQAAKIQDG
jgi:MarR family transcriptional regulator, organic hydroperoxide resistance regulator